MIGAVTFGDLIIRWLGFFGQQLRAEIARVEAIRE